MNTIEVVEHLLFENPNLREPLCILGIINEERNVSPSRHLEFSNILKPFYKNEKFVIISIFGLIQSTIFISQVPSRRKYIILKIDGYNTELLNMSKTYLEADLLQILNKKDFLPPPLVKKIVYFSDYINSEGVIFSEYENNIWTLGDPMLLEPENHLETTGREIIHQLILEVLNNG